MIDAVRAFGLGRVIFFLTSRPVTIGIAALILWGTLMRHVPAMPAAVPNDKTLHLLAFAALVFPRTFLKPARWKVYAALALTLGATIELVQPSVGRTAEWADFAADAAGVGLGVIAALALGRLTGLR